MVTKEFKVKGMHCRSCETLIAEGLADIEGVERAEGSHAQGKVTVAFDPSRVSAERLRKAIHDEGYEVVRG